MLDSSPDDEIPTRYGSLMRVWLEILCHREARNVVWLLLGIIIGVSCHERRHDNARFCAAIHLSERLIERISSFDSVWSLSVPSLTDEDQCDYTYKPRGRSNIKIRNGIKSMAHLATLLYEYAIFGHITECCIKRIGSCERQNCVRNDRLDRICSQFGGIQAHGISYN